MPLTVLTRVPPRVARVLVRIAFPLPSVRTLALAGCVLILAHRAEHTEAVLRALVGNLL